MMQIISEIILSFLRLFVFLQISVNSFVEHEYGKPRLFNRAKKDL